MKYLITSTGSNIDSKIDMRFGRSKWFCYWDTESRKVQFAENKYRNLNGGAGTKAAEMAAEANAAKVISGDFGPKAKSLLEKLNIQMIIINSQDKTVGDIIASLKQ